MSSITLQWTPNKLSRLNLAELSRRWHTLRYYRPKQVGRRILNLARQRFVAHSRPSHDELRDALELKLGDAFSEFAARRIDNSRTDGRAVARHAEVQAGRLTFLNQSVVVGTPVAWGRAQVAELPRLWRFQFQYHDWLLEALAGDATPEAAARCWQTIARWIEHQECEDFGDKDAWHPYCISRRIPVWLALWAIEAPPSDLRPRITQSLYQQANWLASHLERDLGGNHLLENARALVLIGVAASGEPRQRWLELGRQILDAELPEQILPHGEHFERSPMYHRQMTELLADVADVTRSENPSFSETCRTYVQSMQAVTTGIAHPDGDIPLFGDSALGDMPRLPTPRVDSPQSRCVGDYWTYRNGDDFLIFDAGPVGPDHLPAHAHADLLTFEASVDGRRLIVDSGTFDYEDGEMRQYCRSTAAHNTLEIDGQNQCDVWSRFRMGRRGWPSKLQSGEQGGIRWASVSHNAYRHLDVPTVTRWIGCAADEWLIVDFAEGHGEHRLASRLHMHPDAAVEPIGDNRFCVRHGDRQINVRTLGSGAAEITHGWYCPEFGVRTQSIVLQTTACGSPPLVVGWQISLGAATRDARVSYDPSARLLLHGFEAPLTICSVSSGIPQ